MPLLFGVGLAILLTFFLRETGPKTRRAERRSLAGLATH